MTQLHTSGCSLDDINQCLQLAPLEPEMIATIQMAAKLGYVTKTCLEVWLG